MAGLAADPFIDAPERLTEFFRDDAALRVCALDASNALEYFYLSPFYNPDCINEKIRTGQVDKDHAVYLTGLEYVLRPTGQEPRLFIVERRHRRSGSKDVAVLSVYYILDGSIFQCPDAATLLASRVERAAFHIYSALQALEAIQAGSAAPSEADAGTVAPPSAAAAHDPRFDAAVAEALSRQL